MIKEFKEIVDGDKLNIIVSCSVRKYACHPIKTLTTEEILDRLKDRYNIIEVLKTPTSPVGNSERRKIKLTGTWVFKIKENKAEEKIEQETKKDPTPPRKPRRKRQTTSTKPKESGSIRNRISKLASKED